MECESQPEAVRPEWKRLLENCVRWHSLNGLPSLLCHDLVEKRQIVEPGEIGHLAPEKSIVKGLLRRGCKRAMQGIVGHLHARKRLVEHRWGQGFSCLGENLLVQKLLGIP